MNYHRGFVPLLILLIVAALLLGGGAAYFRNLPNFEAGQLAPALSSTSSPARQSASSQKIHVIPYAQATTEQKQFLDRVFATPPTSSYTTKDKMVLFYFNSSTNFAVAGYSDTDSQNSDEYSKNHFTIGFFHPENTGGPGARFVGSGPFQEDTFSTHCKDVSTFSSPCLYVTDSYLVMTQTNEGRVLAYKAGEVDYDRSLLQKSSPPNGLSYVKEYDSNYVPVVDTSFNGTTLAATLYRDNQSLGMGHFDLTKKNDPVDSVSFDLSKETAIAPDLLPTFLGQQTWPAYKNADFSINYPQGIAVATLPDGEISFSSSFSEFDPKYNAIHYAYSLEVNPYKYSKEECDQLQEPTASAPTINGVVFQFTTWGYGFNGAGPENGYDEKGSRYVTYHNNVCYAITSKITYSPSPPRALSSQEAARVNTYKAQAEEVLNRMVTSFVFIK